MKINWNAIYYISMVTFTVALFVIMLFGQRTGDSAARANTPIGSLSLLVFWGSLVVTGIAWWKKPRPDKPNVTGKRSTPDSNVTARRIWLFIGFIVILMFLFMFMSNGRSPDPEVAASAAGTNSLLIGLLVVGILFFAGYVVLLYQGVKYFYRLVERGDYANARRILPFIPNNQSHRAALYRAQGDYEAAVDLLTGMIQRQPASTPSAQTARQYQERGITYQEWGQVDNAIEDYQEALRLQPEFIYAAVSLGSAYVREKDFDAAQDIFERALQQAQRPADRSLIYAYMANKAAKMGDAAQTRDYNQQAEAAAVNNDQKTAVLALSAARTGEIDLAAGNIAGAYQAFQQAYELMPENRYFIAWAALMRVRQGETAVAQSLWNTLVARNARYQDAAWVASSLELPDAIRPELDTLAG